MRTSKANGMSNDINGSLSSVGLFVSGGHLHGQSLDRHHLRSLSLQNRGLADRLPDLPLDHNLTAWIEIRPGDSDRTNHSFNPSDWSATSALNGRPRNDSDQAADRHDSRQ